jgi:hypothetical protein
LQIGTFLYVFNTMIFLHIFSLVVGGMVGASVDRGSQLSQ